MSSLLILAIDTSTEFSSVALLKIHSDSTASKNSLAQCFFQHAKADLASSHILLPMISAVLDSAQIQLHDCDAIAYGNGPGSFTGLRTTASIVQGLAFGANLPVIAVSSLMASAEYIRLQSASCLFFNQFEQYIANENKASALNSHANTLFFEFALENIKFDKNMPAEFNVIATRDARMNEIYWANYSWQHEHSCWQIRHQPQVSKISSISLPNTPYHLIGNASDFFDKNEMQNSPVIAYDNSAIPHAIAIAVLGLHSWYLGQKLPAHSAQPIYIRDKVALKIAERNA